MEAEGTAGGAGKISFRAERQSRDLLMRFSGSGSVDGRTEAAGGDSDEIDLSLCLSLGGSLCVDSSENKLVRSSSMIASLTMLPGEEGFAVAAPLVRTCSLPTEAEENRKRREMQCLKRLEAKRKRSEKRNLWPVAAAVERPEERSEEHVEGRRVRTAKVGKIEVELRGCPRFVEAVGGVAGAAAGSLAPISQGSVGSQGSSVSGAPNFEVRPMQGIDGLGSSSCTPAKNPSTVQSLPEHNRATAAPRTASVGRAALRKVERNVMEEMPCVSTKGEGPNGRRIEGFLYKYRKGEEVRIVCVCHGSFLSPAEFIRHAGGGDVAHPLKHIVVNPSPSTF